MFMYARYFSLLCWVVTTGVVFGQEQTAPQSDAEGGRALRGTKVTDLHGDPLPRGAAIRFGTLRLRPGEGASGTLSFSPDGSRILTGGTKKNTIGLWSVDTGTEVLPVCIPKAHSLCAALSPDGKLVAIGTAEHKVHVFDLRTEKEIRQLRGHSAEVYSVAFSPDGKVVASSGWDETVRLWDITTGKLVRRLNQAPDGLLSDLAYSPDGRLLASSDNKNIWLWEPARGRLRWHIRWDQGFHAHIAFSPRGDVLISCSSDHSIRAWDVKSGKERFRLLGHRKPVQALAFSPDGKTIASTSEDWTIRLWDVATRKETGRIENGDYPSALAFSPDGKWLAAKGSAIRLWDAASLKERIRWPGHYGAVSSLTFSPNGRVLVSSADTVRFWDVTSGKELRRLPPPTVEWYSEVEFSPDGKSLAYTAPPSTVRLLDAATAKTLSQLEVNGGGIDGITFSPDGTLLATTSRDNKLRLWCLASRKEVRQWDEKPLRSFHPTFSSDDRLLATVWHDEAHGLEVATGRERFHIPLDGRNSRLHFLPGTQTLLAIDEADFMVSRWTAIGKLQDTRRLRGQHDYRLGDEVVSPDGRLLATAEEQGGTVALWELATGEQIERFEGHHIDVRCVRFSPDGLFLASASTDTTILLWDITGRIDKRYTPRSPLRRTELDELWEKLGNSRAAEAYRAAWTLVSIPDRAVPYLAERVPPIPAVPAERFRQLLADLDSDSFETRERASRALTASGDAVAAQVRDLLGQGRLSVEVKKRLQAVLNTIESDPNRLRLQRVITTLEYMRNPTAQALLKRLAQGAAEAQLTQDAKAALQRLSRPCR